MKVIICGAGQVGFNIAHYLAMEHNEITVIDQRSDLIRKISDSLDVQVVAGHASHPSVLEQAGAADADMIIAVTQSDEVNMVACQVAHSLFQVPKKIARVRSQPYLQPMWSNLFSSEHMPIDVIISPEVEVAKSISRRLQVPGTIEVIPLAGDKVRLIGVRCTRQTPLINTPLRQLTVLFPDLSIVVVGIVRNGRPIIPTSEDQFFDGDEVYYVVDTEHVSRTLTAFGCDEASASRRLVILGGGNIGLFLAQNLETEQPESTIKIVEANKERAEFIARTLNRTVVLHGDALENDMLIEAGMATAQTVISVTNEDETNILSSLLSKRLGARRAITLTSKTGYNVLMGPLGIDVAVNPRAITVSSVLHYVRKGRIHSAHSLYDGFGELLEADALESSPLVGKPLREVRFPNGVLLGAIVRNGKVITPRGATIIQAGDRVILFAAADAVKKVEKMFQVRLGFF